VFNYIALTLNIITNINLLFLFELFFFAFILKELQGWPKQ